MFCRTSTEDSLYPSRCQKHLPPAGYSWRSMEEIRLSCCRLGLQTVIRHQTGLIFYPHLTQSKKDISRSFSFTSFLTHRHPWLRLYSVTWLSGPSVLFWVRSTFMFLGFDKLIRVLLIDNSSSFLASL